MLPKIRRCPQCNSINLLKINGITYKNNFQSLCEWTLKKIFNCRKCKVELGLFLHSINKKNEKLVWIDLLQCEDFYHNELNQLQSSVVKLKIKNKKYYAIRKKISDIQNQIRLEQAKVKIKTKIENKGMLI